MHRPRPTPPRPHAVFLETVACLWWLSCCASAQDPAPPSARPTPVASQRARAAGVDPDVLRRLDEIVARAVEDELVVGAELLVVHGGRPLLHSAHGWRDREPPRSMQPGSLFNIRSMTKPLVGSAALRLAEQGRIDLEDPVALYVEAPLEQVVGREVLEPLGLRDTSAMTTREQSLDERLSSDHISTGNGWQAYWRPGDGPLAPFVLGSGTTWYATPADYARFVGAWMDARRGDDEGWLTQSAARAALQPLSPMAYRSRVPGLRVHYGRAWQVHIDRDDAVVAFGHGGSDGTYAWAWPGADVVVLYFTQSRGKLTRLALEQHLDALLAPEPAPAAGDGAADPDADPNTDGSERPAETGDRR